MWGYSWCVAEALKRLLWVLKLDIVRQKKRKEKKGKKRHLKKKKLVQHFRSSIYIYSTNVHSETFRGRSYGERRGSVMG